MNKYIYTLFLFFFSFSYLFSQNLVPNGSFEQPSVGGCGFGQNCNIPSWTLLNCGGTPNLIIPVCNGGSPNATDGNQALQIYTASGSGVATLTQTIAVSPCNTYRFSFDYSSVYSAIECFDWSITGGHTASGLAIGTTTWQTVNFTFTPTSNSITLNFTNKLRGDCPGSTSGLNYTSPQIDNVSIVVTNSATINTSETVSACGSIVINGTTYTSSQTISNTFPTSGGCDSTHTVNLTINNNTSSTDVQNHCGAYTWIDGVTYTASTNTPTFTINKPNGCDSIVTLNLTISTGVANPPISSSFNTGSNGTGSTLPGGSNDLLWTVSTTNLNGTYNPAFVMTSTPAVYYNSPWPDAAWIANNPNGTHTVNQSFYYQANFELPCEDCIYNNFCLNLDVFSDNTITEIYVNGIPQSPYGTFTPNTGGFSAASILSLSFCNDWQGGNNSIIFEIFSTPGFEAFLAQSSVNPPPTTDIDSIFQTICSNETFTFDGTALNAAGVYNDTLQDALGCDSIVVLTLLVNPSDSTFENLTSCNPIDTGTVVNDLTNVFLCDSVHTVTTTLLRSDSTFENLTSCNPIDTGTVVSDLTNVFLCDSVHTVTTTLLRSDSTFENLTSCNPIDTGTVVNDLTNVFLCDSVHTVTTTLLRSDSTIENLTSCNPIDTGTVVNDLTNVFLCDSVHTVTTTLLRSDSTFENLTSCNPIDTGVVVNDLTNVFLCDSVHTVTTTLLRSDSTFENLTSCNPIDTGVVVNDLTNVFLCDSVHTVTTTLLRSDSTFENLTSCNPIDTGVVVNDLTNVFLCDSVHTVTTTLLRSDSTFESLTSCNPLDTGIVVSDLTNVFLCDSVHTVTTTLLRSDFTFENLTSCNPIDTGVVVNDLTNVFLCDSVHTVTTTLLRSDSTFENLTSCNPIDTGVLVFNLSNVFLCDSVHTITTSLVFSDTTFESSTSCNPTDTGVFVTNLTNISGCDSTHTTAITLLPSSSSAASLTSCNPQEAGVVINNLTNVFGCDSIHTVTTILLPSDSTFETLNSCFPSDTGRLVETSLNQFGCDSVHTIITNLLELPYSVFPDVTTINAGDSLNFVINNADANLQFQWQATDNQSCGPLCASFIVNPTENTTLYYFTLLDTATGCSGLDTIRVDLEYFSQLNVPNIFTPNGDGENDIYRAYGEDVVAYKLEIFDRWGGKMFESNALPDGWDGLFKGLPVESGTYIAVITAAGADGQRYEIVQNIKLVR